MILHAGRVVPPADPIFGVLREPCEHLRSQHEHMMRKFKGQNPFGMSRGTSLLAFAQDLLAVRSAAVAAGRASGRPADWEMAAALSDRRRVRLGVHRVIVFPQTFYTPPGRANSRYLCFSSDPSKIVSQVNKVLVDFRVGCQLGHLPVVNRHARISDSSESLDSKKACGLAKYIYPEDDELWLRHCNNLQTDHPWREAPFPALPRAAREERGRTSVLTRAP